MRSREEIRVSEIAHKAGPPPTATGQKGPWIVASPVEWGWREQPQCTAANRAAPPATIRIGRNFVRGRSVASSPVAWESFPHLGRRRGSPGPSDQRRMDGHRVSSRCSGSCWLLRILSVQLTRLKETGERSCRLQPAVGERQDESQTREMTSPKAEKNIRQ